MARKTQHTRAPHKGYSPDYCEVIPQRRYYSRERRVALDNHAGAPQ